MTTDTPLWNIHIYWSLNLLCAAHIFVIPTFICGSNAGRYMHENGHDTGNDTGNDIGWGMWEQLENGTMNDPFHVHTGHKIERSGMTEFLDLLTFDHSPEVACPLCIKRLRELICV